MIVNLAPGERVLIKMEDAEDDDDGIMVEYDFQSSGRFVVSANYPDDKDRDGVIYSATMDENREAEEERVEEDDDAKNAVVKQIECVSCGLPFNLTQGEVDFMQKIFGEKYREPIRCKKCRMLRMRRKRTPKKAV